MKKVFIIHTSAVSVKDLTDLFTEYGPDVKLHHIIDDSLLAEVLEYGGVTPAVRSRMCSYYKAAEEAGADLIFNQCSSVGEAADIASKVVRVPVVKVDSCMAEEACKTGRRIGVVATLETTLGPTCRLVEFTAYLLGKEINVVPKLVEGAFDLLVGGDRPAHNKMVLDAIRDLSREVDVIVCAQGSMIAILSELEPLDVPVLTSPRSGVQRAIETLEKTGGQGSREVH